MANHELVDFIAKREIAGKPEEEIRAEALAHGWAPEDINGAFGSLHIRSGLRGVSGGFSGERHEVRKTAPRGEFNSLVIFVILLIPVATYVSTVYGTQILAFMSAEFGLG